VYDTADTVNGDTLYPCARSLLSDGDSNPGNARARARAERSTKSTVSDSQRDPSIDRRLWTTPGDSPPRGGKDIVRRNAASKLQIRGGVIRGEGRVALMGKVQRASRAPFNREVWILSCSREFMKLSAARERRAKRERERESERNGEEPSTAT